MSIPTFNTKSPTIKRILREAQELRSHPDSSLHAAPLDSNLFEWHFTIRGPPGTPYSSGIYHGRIILPPTYPLRPPSFRFVTPSGRFEVNREICLSISGHHEETWQPAWGIRTALWALRAFMEGDAKGQVGGMEMAKSERERLAIESTSWKCSGCGGRSNEAILKEEGGEDTVSATDTESDSKPAIPDELRFGFKDEMAQTLPPKLDKGKGKEVSEPPIINDKNGTIPSLTPTRTIPSTGLAQLPPPPVPSRPRQMPVAMPVGQTSTDGVPGWVDKAITGVGTALALMILKKILL